MAQVEVTHMGVEKRILQGVLAGAFAATLLGSTAAQANEVLWGLQAENVEYRFGEDEDVAAWDFDFFVGTDELKVVWRSEAEFSIDEREFETLENQMRLQVPISRFFDAAVGVRVDTPEGANRACRSCVASLLDPAYLLPVVRSFRSSLLCRRTECRSGRPKPDGPPRR